MRVAFVLHLEPAALAAGQLRGEVEEVLTGRIGALSTWADLSAFCVASLATLPVPRSDWSDAATPVVSDDNAS